MCSRIIIISWHGNVELQGSWRTLRSNTHIAPWKSIVESDKYSYNKQRNMVYRIREIHVSELSSSHPDGNVELQGSRWTLRSNTHIAPWITPPLPPVLPTCIFVFLYSYVLLYIFPFALLYFCILSYTYITYLYFHISTLAPLIMPTLPPPVLPTHCARVFHCVTHAYTHHLQG